MWVPKYVRDRNKGVDSPLPTQAVSNEEIYPRPQNENQKKVEALIGEWGERNARRVGMDRRDFMRSSMGLATCFLASNAVFGRYYDVDEAEAFDPQAIQERWPKGAEFIIDAQSHFTIGVPLGFRSSEFLRNMGGDYEAVTNSPEQYMLPNFVKEMFFDSDTSMVIISGVPGRERDTDAQGNPLEGRARGGGVLPSWLMSQAKKRINEIAGCERALCQGNCAPNHYMIRGTRDQDLPRLFDQMEREVTQYGIDSWKWYCHTGSIEGFQLDDEMSAKFYEKSRELGMKIFSVHKGFSYQSVSLGHLANPRDVEKAALDNPDLTFIIYHSALKHGPTEPDYENLNQFDPATGDFLWHDVLMDIKRRNPEMTNVYPEIGSSFGLLAIEHPAMCAHLMGRNIKQYGADHVIWGTDCLWWGSPQWAIEALRRFTIPDEMIERFGYAPITDADKRMIFGENVAKIYGVDLDEKRNALPADAVETLKKEYHGQGFTRENAIYGWVRAED